MGAFSQKIPKCVSNFQEKSLNMGQNSQENFEKWTQLTILRSQNVLITFHFGYENVLILRFKNVKT